MARPPPLPVPHGLSRTRARPSALGALAVAAWAGGSVLAIVVKPPGWGLATAPPPSLHSEPLAGLWPRLAEAIPIAERGLRVDFIVLGLAFACVVAAAWFALALYRGPGRVVASICAATLSAAALGHYVGRVPPETALAVLPATLTATITVEILLRPLVRLGVVPALPRVRALCGAAMTALLLPKIGLPLGIVVLVIAIVRAPPRARPTLAAPVWIHAIAVGWGSVAVIAAGLAALGARWTTIEPQAIGLRWPDMHLLASDLPPLVLYPGACLLLLLVVPLRWRGGPSLLGLCAVAAVLGYRDGPLVPTPVLLVILSTAAAGWVWLAGSALGRKQRRPGIALAIAAACVILTVSLGPPLRRPHPAAATFRAVQVPFRIYERGLIAPGDAVIVNSAQWLAHLEAARRDEAWRPDVEFIAAATLSDAQLREVVSAWDGTDRRVLSDSWRGGGQWAAREVLDSGPLFWLVGNAAPVEQEFTDLSALADPAGTWGEREQRIWTRISVERARHRRALGDALAALGALPVSGTQRRAWLAVSAASISFRPEAELGSELSSASPQSVALEAWIAAEAGDLFYAQGDSQRGAELLVEAAEAGFAPALGTLARWQFRTGEDIAAWDTMLSLVDTAGERARAVEVLRWLLARDRTDDARRLSRMLSERAALDPASAAAEIAARLALQSASAVEPPPVREAPAPPLTNRRATGALRDSSGRVVSDDQDALE